MTRVIVDPDRVRRTNPPRSAGHTPLLAAACTLAGIGIATSAASAVVMGPAGVVAFWAGVILATAGTVWALEEWIGP